MTTLVRTFAIVLFGTLALSGWQARGQTIISCSSDNGKRNFCVANTRGGVSLGKQRSGSACIEGSTWGYDQRGIWVDRGCRADFVLGGRRPGPGPGVRPGPGPGVRPGPGPAPIIISCASNNGRRNYCAANTLRGVRLVRQRSDSACRQGRTWGYDRGGIWVDRGCRADFEVR